MTRRWLFVLLLIVSLGVGSALAQDSGRDGGGITITGGSTSGDSGGGIIIIPPGDNSTGGDTTGGSAPPPRDTSSDDGGSSTGGGSSEPSSDPGSSNPNSNDDPSGEQPREPETSEPEPPTFVPPALPADGCYATPGGNYRVWARTGPFESEPEHGHLVPGRVYQALGLVPGDGGLWVELMDFERADGMPGYAAGAFVLSSDCPIFDAVLADRNPEGSDSGHVLVLRVLVAGFYNPNFPEAMDDNGGPLSHMSDLFIGIGELQNTSPDDREPPLEGVTVYLDLNNNGATSGDVVPVDTLSINFGAIKMGGFGNDLLNADDVMGADDVLVVHILAVETAATNGLEFTEFRMGMSSGREGQSGDDDILIGGTTSYGSIGLFAMDVGNPEDFDGINELVFDFMEPIPDGNGDGIVDAADYTVWRDSRAGDGVVDFQDFRQWKMDASNSDGVVDAGDYAVWRDHYGNTAPSPDSNDYADWEANFGASLPSAADSDEPIPDGFLQTFPPAPDSADYTVWRDNLGSTTQTVDPDGAAVPDLMLVFDVGIPSGDSASKPVCYLKYKLTR